MAVCSIPTRKTRRRHAKMQYKACLREVNESEGGREETERRSILVQFTSRINQTELC